MRNTTTNSPNTTEGKTFKRGKWVKITVGKFAGQKRWYSAATRTKMSQSTRKNKPWVKAALAKNGVFLTDPNPVTAPTIDSPGAETGTTVRLSQETTTKVQNFMGEGVTLEETVDYILTAYLTTVSKQKLAKKITVVLLPPYDSTAEE